MNKGHNYMKEISRQMASGQLGQFPAGQLSHMTVRHDDWCMIWNGGRCNCEPDVKKGEPKQNRAERRAAKRKK